jgi:hypothetical protein
MLKDKVNDTVKTEEALLDLEDKIKGRLKRDDHNLKLELAELKG